MLIMTCQVLSIFVIQLVLQTTSDNDGPCEDKNIQCHTNLEVVGYIASQCEDQPGIKNLCPYMCGECDLDRYEDSSLYFSFDEINNDQFEGKLNDDTIHSNPIGANDITVKSGRRLNGVYINGSSCLNLGNFSATPISQPQSAITISVFFKYQSYVGSNTDLIFITSGGHTNSTGVYFGYHRIENQFVVKVNFIDRQYNVTFTEEELPALIRPLMNMVIVCWYTPDSDDRPGGAKYHEGLKVYIEGKLLKHGRQYTTDHLVDSFTYLHLGCVIPGTTWFYFVELDELAVWNMVLPPQEIISIAIANSKKKFSPPIKELDSTIYGRPVHIDTATHILDSLNDGINTTGVTSETVDETTDLLSRLASSNFDGFAGKLLSSISPTTKVLSKLGDVLENVLVKTSSMSNITASQPDSLLKLSEAVDDFLGQVAKVSLITDSGNPNVKTEIRDNVEITVSVGKTSDETYIYEDGMTVSIKTSDIRTTARVHVLYKGIGELLPTSHNITLQHDPSNKTGNGSYLMLGEDILGMSVYDSNGTVLSTVKYKVNIPSLPGHQVIPHCVFLDSEIGGGDDILWSDKGCVLLQTTNESATCSCDHLTNFAVLLQVIDYEISEEHRQALGLISYIGCTLSILGGILTILTFIFLRIYTDRVMIHMNLAVAIIGSQILLLVEESVIRGTVACIAVIALLYYFYMAVFSWMLVEGIQLILQTVVVFTFDSKMNLFYGLGWGFPLVLAVISLGAINTNLGQHDICWLSPLDNSIWAFAVPAILVISTNLVILVLVLKVVISLSSTIDKSTAASVRSAIKASVLLLPLLGSSWLFGVLAISDTSVMIFQYLFVISTSLQGLLLFLCHCVLNSEVRETFMRRKTVWDIKRQIQVEPVSAEQNIGTFRYMASGYGRTRRAARSLSPSTDSSSNGSTPNMTSHI